MNLHEDLPNILNTIISDVRKQITKLDFVNGTQGINKTITNLLEVLNKTSITLSDIQFELKVEQKNKTENLLNSQFIFLEKSADGSWNPEGYVAQPSIEDINEEINNVVKMAAEKRKIVTLTKVNGIPIPRTKFVVGDSVSNCIVWKPSNKSIDKGLFLNITDTVSIKIPFPNIYDPSNQKFKTKTIKCRNSSKNDCYLYRKNIAIKNNSEIRTCSYVHIGEKYLRQGTQSRCQLSRFGNHETLDKDIKLISESEVKKVMLHCAADLLLIYLWTKYNNIKDRVFEDLEYYH